MSYLKNKIQAFFYYFNQPIVLIIAQLHYYFFSTSSLILFIQKTNPNYSAAILKKFGAQLGSTPNFNGPPIIDNPASGSKPFKNIKIGNNCFVGTNVFFDLPGNIILHDHSILSAGVKILTHQDCGNRPMSKFYPRKVADVEVGENSWVGVNAIILAGVKIGHNAVIAAGAVVTADVEPFTVVGGNPAKFIKSVK